jgi:RNA polymerase sigma-70 factor (ECF subfamily)
MLEDRLLVWKFKGGSRDALRVIYDKYADDLLTLAANLLNDKIGAEDVVQDVFVKFAQFPDKFSLKGTLKGFLAKCVANRSRDYLRSRSRQQTAATKLAERKSSDVSSPVQLVINSEELRKLRHAMSELPYEQKEALVLHLHGGLRFRQIAELQKVSTKTAQSRYRYGLDKLRSSMNGEVRK